jgi:uncharacterized protein YajQ (UPF0234 family)
MQCEIEGQPERFRIAHEPHTKQERDSDHDAKRQCRVSNSKDVIKERPGSKRSQHRETIANGDMRQKVTAFPHEEVAAAWTASGTVEISIEQFSFSTNRTAQSQQRSKLHISILAAQLILLRMPDNSFDVVSVVDMPEVLNAIQQARKEVQTRFDLKDSKSEIDLNEKDKKIVVNSIDDYKLKAVVEVLQQKLAKRKVPLKNFSYGTIQPAAGSTARQEVTIQSGIPVEKSKEIVKKIKDSKIKVQASIQGDLVRVSGKSRDLLQEVIQLLRGSDFGLELQFTNYRTF